MEQSTEQYLIERYGMTLTVENLAEVMHMSPRSVQNSIGSGRFPIKTYKIGNRRVADACAVAEYLDAQREKAA